MEKFSTADNLSLSLCIPTYNRLTFLAEALSAIIIQIDDKVVQVVEILISNNASTDDTEKYVKEVIANHPHLQIRYLCNEENMGADTNIYRVTKQAKGEWIYMLSDDDILLPGGLAKLLELIKKYPNFDAFCLNMYPFENDPYIKGKSLFNIAEDKIITNKDDALLFLNTSITFMSVVAFKRIVLERCDCHDKIGTSLFQCYIYLHALVNANGLYIVKDNFLAIRANNIEGYNVFNVFIKNFGDVLIYAKNLGYSDKIVEKILIQHGLVFLIRGIKSMRLQPERYIKLNVNYQQAISLIRSTYFGTIPLKLTGYLLILLIKFPLNMLLVADGLFKSAKSFIKRMPFNKNI